MGRRLFTDDQERIIADCYRMGLSTPRLGELYATSHATIRNALRRQGVQARSIAAAKRLDGYHIYEEAFSPPLGPDAEYWVGFLLADGTIRDDGAVVLHLRAGDRGHVEKFREFVDAEAPIFYAAKTHSVGVAVCSRRVANDLIGWGVTPRKSLVCRADEDLSDSPDFWRGVIDGNGSISRDTLSLVGGQLLLEQWRSFARLFGRQPGLRRKDGELFESRCHSEVRRYLLTVLYGNARENARLDRKYVAATGGAK